MFEWFRRDRLRVEERPPPEDPGTDEERTPAAQIGAVAALAAAGAGLVLALGLLILPHGEHADDGKGDRLVDTENITGTVALSGIRPHVPDEASTEQRIETAFAEPAARRADWPWNDLDSLPEPWNTARYASRFRPDWPDSGSGEDAVAVAPGSFSLPRRPGQELSDRLLTGDVGDGPGLAKQEEAASAEAAAGTDDPEREEADLASSPRQEHAAAPGSEEAQEEAAAALGEDGDEATGDAAAAVREAPDGPPVTAGISEAGDLAVEAAGKEGSAPGERQAASQPKVERQEKRKASKAASPPEQPAEVVQADASEPEPKDTRLELPLSLRPTRPAIH